MINLINTGESYIPTALITRAEKEFGLAEDVTRGLIHTVMVFQPKYTYALSQELWAGTTKSRNYRPPSMNLHIVKREALMDGEYHITMESSPPPDTIWPIIWDHIAYFAENGTLPANT